MKWFIAFLLILVLGNGHLFLGLDKVPAFVGLPGWLYYYILLHCLFIVLLKQFSHTIKEEEL